MKDLHIHTRYSDGEDDEIEIVKKVIDAKIDEFAICDHDTIEGSKRVNDYIKKNNIDVVFHSGVELTCRVNDFCNGVNVHLLVRDFDYDNKKLLNLINEVSLLRKKKIGVMVEHVYKIYGVKISSDKINKVLQVTSSFGKPHIYNLLLEYGNYSREEFYKNMKGLDTSHLKLDASRVIKELNDSECYVTLAHPKEIMEEYNFSYDDIDKLVYHLAHIGLKGLEVYHSKHNVNDSKIFLEIAKKYNLIDTCGSDYHGLNIKPNVKLGKINK